MSTNNTTTNNQAPAGHKETKFFRTTKDGATIYYNTQQDLDRQENFAWIKSPEVKVTAKREPLKMAWHKFKTGVDTGWNALKDAWLNRKTVITPEEHKQNMIQDFKMGLTKTEMNLGQTENYSTKFGKLNERAPDMGYIDGSNPNSLLGDAFKGNIKHKGGYRA